MQKELFAQLASVVIFCKTAAQYQNQEIDTGAIHGYYSNFTSFTCALLCVCAFSSITVQIPVVSSPVQIPVVTTVGHMGEGSSTTRIICVAS